MNEQKSLRQKMNSRDHPYAVSPGWASTRRRSRTTLHVSLSSPSQKVLWRAEGYPPNVLLSQLNRTLDLSSCSMTESFSKEYLESRGLWLERQTTRESSIRARRYLWHDFPFAQSLLRLRSGKLQESLQFAFLFRQNLSRLVTDQQCSLHAGACS